MFVLVKLGKHFVDLCGYGAEKLGEMCPSSTTAPMTGVREVDNYCNDFERHEPRAPQMLESSGAHMPTVER